MVNLSSWNLNFYATFMVLNVMHGQISKYFVQIINKSWKLYISKHNTHGTENSAWFLLIAIKLQPEIRDALLCEAAMFTNPRNEQLAVCVNTAWVPSNWQWQLLLTVMDSEYVCHSHFPKKTVDRIYYINVHPFCPTLHPSLPSILTPFL